MFTGIVEEIGVVKEFARNSQGATIKIGCSKVLGGTKIGDSIAVNGICLTIRTLTNKSIIFEISNETIKYTNIDALNIGKTINLERSLKLSERIDGHIVSGHIDGTATIVDVKNDGFSYLFEFKTTETGILRVMTIFFRITDVRIKALYISRISKNRINILMKKIFLKKNLKLN